MPQTCYGCVCVYQAFRLTCIGGAKSIFSSTTCRYLCGGAIRHFYPQADTLRVHLTLTLWVQCIVHLRSTFYFLPSKLTRRYVVLYALVHYEKAVFIERSAVYIVTEPTVN